ncbi:barstar family protein [Asanoa sp. WMMD1127]|uniref:barstar family protein n=1 Tax=Asanoa sp. WMMD1127 TaxID=3016107 RepID=UPI002415FEF5|nr:barstar family protein [Asanoa sp. WMMD1127]MDG4822016.1 barstar family protein [Asanoa sp. WMMD1127]
MAETSIGRMRPRLAGPPYVVSEGDLQRIRHTARSMGMTVVSLVVPERPSRRVVLDGLGRALGFAEWGSNWDAWDDILSGYLDDLPRRVLVLVERVDRLVAASPALFAEIVYLLQRTSDGQPEIEFVFAGRWP